VNWPAGRLAGTSDEGRVAVPAVAPPGFGPWPHAVALE